MHRKAVYVLFLCILYGAISAKVSARVLVSKTNGYDPYSLFDKVCWDRASALPGRAGSDMDHRLKVPSDGLCKLRCSNWPLKIQVDWVWCSSPDSAGIRLGPSDRQASILLSQPCKVTSSKSDITLYA